MREKILCLLLCMFFISSFSFVGIADEPLSNTAPYSPKIAIVHGNFRHDPIILGENAQVKISCSDEENNPLYYRIDWRDGQISEWMGPFITGEWEYFNHSYTSTGEYYVRFIARDDPNGDGDLSDGLNSSWKTTTYFIKVYDGRPPKMPLLYGPSIGTVGEAYTFTVYLGDSLDRSLQLQWDWGDGEGPQGWDSGYRSNTTKKISHMFDQSGSYEVRVRSSERLGFSFNTGQPSPWSDSVFVVITEDSTPVPMDQLDIIVLDNEIIEQEEFSITVIAGGSYVKGASVDFDGYSALTDESGAASFTAPEVEGDTVFVLSAKKQDYLSTEESIIIHNTIEEIEPFGWIFGSVYSDDGKNILGVEVCASRIGVSSSDCALTQEQDGTIYYYLLLPPGTYSLQASKTGYVTKTISKILVGDREAIQADFILEETGTPADNQDSYIDDIIEEGLVGAEIRIGKQTGSTVKYYSYETISVDIDTPTDTSIELTISAEDNTSGKIFITSIENTVFSSSELELLFDGQEIQEISVDDLATLQDSENPVYAIYQAEGEDTIVYVYVPHFSTHTITISSIIKTVSIILLFTLYAAVCVIGAMGFIRAVYGSTFRFPGRRRKE